MPPFHSMVVWVQVFGMLRYHPSKRTINGNDQVPMPKRSVEPIQQNHNKTCGCLFNCCKWLDIPIHRWTLLLHRVKSITIDLAGRILQREAALQMQRLHRGVRENVFFVFFWLSRSSNIWLWGIWRRYEMMFECFSSWRRLLRYSLEGWGGIGGFWSSTGF